MSRYDAAVIDTAIIEDARMLTCTRGQRLMYVEMLIWSKLHRSDGFIPNGALRRLTDEEEYSDAADRLVEVGLLTDHDDGWRIPDFKDSQWTKDQVLSRLTSDRKRSAEYYDRQRKAKSHASENAQDHASSHDADRSIDRSTDRPIGLEGESRPRSGRSSRRPSRDGGAVCLGCGAKLTGNGYGTSERPLCFDCSEDEEKGQSSGPASVGEEAGT